MNFLRFLTVLYPFLLVLSWLISQSQLQVLANFNPGYGNVSSSVKCIERERHALLDLKQGFQLDNESYWLSSWGNGENQKECCNWEGVQCSNETGHVLKLDLHDDDGYNNIAGSISSSLTELHHLKYLDLSGNHFPYSSPIPHFIGFLTHLRHLNLSYCGFGGKIPNALGNLFYLEYLDLGTNRLNGTVPSQVSNLSHLVHLDLGGNSLDGKIPSQLANLSSLQYLNLRYNRLNGTIPPQLGNLISLKYLDLGGNEFTGTIPYHIDNLSNSEHLDFDFFQRRSLRSDLQWVSHLSSLRYLSLNGVNLSSANSWQWLVSGLSHLQHLDFSSCNLPDSTPSPFSSVANFSTSLSFVDLSGNNLKSSSLIFPWLLNYTSSLAILSLDSIDFRGTIPESFGNLSSLQSLDLGGNHLEGKIPISLFHICSLSRLDLSFNALAGQFHEFVQQFSHCAHNSIQYLHLGWNEITGIVPDLSYLSSLQVLDLGSNKLNGTLNEGIGKLPNLEQLSLGSNFLQGSISEAHFSRLYKLFHLDLSHNALVFNVSTEWIPPFNLSLIYLASCILGPNFPRWLETQKQLQELDISSAEISETVPKWFWNLPQVWGLDFLNLSHNAIGGEIEDLPLVHPIAMYMDLSSNLFEGSIPVFLTMAQELDLSNNKFSMATPFLCANTTNFLTFLDLSNNHLRGELPDCSVNFQSLVFLDLSNNYFTGNLPEFMGSLRHVQALHLGGNSFSGEIPASLNNCKELIVFDASRNNLSGPVPSWIGYELRNLLVLSLHSNKFHGSMPSTICLLSELHVLDLSLNNISGNIPKCINKLSAMTSQANLNATITISYFDNEHYSGFLRSSSYNDSTTLIWKGKMLKYKSTLGLLRSIDLSRNRLIGEVPSEITSLVGLV